MGVYEQARHHVFKSGLSEVSASAKGKSGERAREGGLMDLPREFFLFMVAFWMRFGQNLSRRAALEQAAHLYQ